MNMGGLVINQTLVADKISMAALIVSVLSLVISVVGVFVQKNLIG